MGEQSVDISRNVTLSSTSVLTVIMLEELKKGCQ